MSRADSTHIKWLSNYESSFEMEYEDIDKELLLYVSAIGYNSRYIDVGKGYIDLGKIVMLPLSMSMDEVTVSGRAPIEHKFERGRDEYTIPQWMGEQEYDLNSLLSLIPGMAMVKGKIQIAGIGTPIYLVNGLNPRPGEMENISPRDIEKITIIRMPSGKFDQNVLGIISIETIKKWYDYLSVRLSNDFSYTNVVNNRSSVSINYKNGKLSHFLNFRYNYAPLEYDMSYDYETHIQEEDINYRMFSAIDMYEKNITPGITYSPRYQFNSSSFIDLQYYFSREISDGNRLTCTNFFNTRESDLLSRSLIDARKSMHTVILRYDNTFDGKRRLTFNTIFMRVDDERENDLKEESTQAGQTVDESRIAYWQNYRNEVLSSSLDYKSTLADALEIETGASYANTWIRNELDYHTQGTDTDSRARNEQAVVYLNADHGIGKFHWQAGLRGQYEYRHGEIGDFGKRNSFYFLPSAGMSYAVNDKLNIMLYYRRATTYPTESQLNTNKAYVHKYLYFIGNPNLKPTVLNSFMMRVAFPYNLSLTGKYSYDKNDILRYSITDPDDPKIVIMTYENMDKSNTAALTLSWSNSFKFYQLNLSASYLQIFSKSPYLDKKIKYNRPGFAIGAYNSFTITPNIQTRVVLNYQSSLDYYSS